MKKLLVLMFLLTNIFVNASEFPSYTFHGNEARCLESQILKLKQLPLARQQEESLLINYTRQAGDILGIQVFVGKFSIEDNEAKPNQNYIQHDQAQKIFDNIFELLMNQPGNLTLHRMFDHLEVGSSMLSSISLED